VPEWGPESEVTQKRWHAEQRPESDVRPGQELTMGELEA
jgi:hypothetical protein